MVDEAHQEERPQDNIPQEEFLVLRDDPLPSEEFPALLKDFQDLQLEGISVLPEGFHARHNQDTFLVRLRDISQDHPQD